MHENGKIAVSKENDADFEFFRKFKVSLCPENLSNLDAKGAKRSVKSWATNFYKIFFPKYFVVHERSAVRNSFSTYVSYDPDSLIESVYQNSIGIFIFEWLATDQTLLQSLKQNSNWSAHSEPIFFSLNFGVSRRKYKYWAFSDWISSFTVQKTLIQHTHNVQLRILTYVEFVLIQVDYPFLACAKCASSSNHFFVYI